MNGWRWSGNNNKIRFAGKVIRQSVNTVCLDVCDHDNVVVAVEHNIVDRFAYNLELPLLIWIKQRHSLRLSPDLKGCCLYRSRRGLKLVILFDPRYQQKPR